MIMTLPPSYNTSSEYVADSLTFLKSFHWLYNYSNTHILVNKVFTNFPTVWLSYFNCLSTEELNSLPLGDATENCPPSLKNVLNKLESLKPNTLFVSRNCDHNLSHNSGLSLKKLHEITCLAPIIDGVCKENGANFVIDVGSENCQVRRLKRKSGKTHLADIDDDFQKYLNNLKNTHQLEYNDDKPAEERLKIDSENFLKKMREKWDEQKRNCYLVEVLTAFQASLQSVCENLILLDRVEFLKEKGFDCYVQKVTNDRLSPRCYALIAFK